jgi:membrane protease YdiL (CAAX protease family)
VLLAGAWFQDSAGASGTADLPAEGKVLAATFCAMLVAATLAVLPLAWRLSASIAGTDIRGRARESKPVAWGFAEIGLVFTWVIVFALGLHFVAPSGAAEPDLIGILLRSALLLGTTGLLIAGIARFRGPEGLLALGLRAGGNLRGMLGGWFAYAAMVPGGIGLAFGWRWLLERVGIPSELQVVVTKFLELGAAAVPFALVLGIAVMPFLEELIFRGFLQPVFVKHVGARWGVAATSLIFAGLHGPSAFLPIFALSLVLGTVMLRTQRLLAAWSVHALHNGLVFCVLLYLRAHPELAPQSGLLAFF